MIFYYPLTLGVRKPKPVRVDRADHLQNLQYDAWREGVQRLEYGYEEYPEARVLETIQQVATTQGYRFWLILGEPGAGKTTLLVAWFTRWATRLPNPYLGMVMPVLVRLRYVQAQETLQDSERLADRFWRLGLTERALLKGQGERIYRQDRGRWFSPGWLLDGLDEVVPLPDEQFYQALVNLPGVKVLTCRTAVYEARRSVSDRYKAQEYKLLGLQPKQQRAFLIDALNGDARGAEVLITTFSTTFRYVCSPLTRRC